MLQTGHGDSGHWIYPGDPLTDDRAEVRFLIGDTQSTDQLLSDEEINAALKMSERSGRPGGSVTTSALTVSGATGIGATSINLAAALVTGTLEDGDTFTVAGDPTRYLVTTTITAVGNLFTTVTFWPGLVVAATDGAAVLLHLGNTYEAAALCCDHLARRFAREADITDTGRTVAYSQRSRAYAAQAATLRLQG